MLRDLLLILQLIVIVWLLLIVLLLDHLILILFQDTFHGRIAIVLRRNLLAEVTALRRADDFTLVGVMALASLDFLGLGSTAASSCRLVVLLFDAKGRGLSLLLELARDDDFGLFRTIVAPFILLLLTLLRPDRCATR